MKSIKNYITEAVNKQISDSAKDFPQVKLYDSGKQYKGYPDRYTLYFPYPQWLKDNDNYEGTFLGCSPSYDGRMTRCIFDMVEIGENVNFGKEIPLSSMPQGFQDAANELISKWYDALKYDDDKHWEEWCNKA